MSRPLQAAGKPPNDVLDELVAGAQAANTVGLAAARQHVLARAGWDVERAGLNVWRVCGSTWPTR